MVRRHAASAFGNAFAFPGGVVEAADRAVAGNCGGIGSEEADRLLDADHGLDYFSAAIRELFEETGVLLADIDGTPVSCIDVRDGLNSGTERWDRFVSRHQVGLRCDALHYFAYWITPLARRRRYSTRFFLAAMPDDQQALHCGVELTESCWTTAADALRGERDGSMLMHFPTRRTLEQISRHQSLDALLAWADGRAASGVPCIFPDVREHRGEPHVFVDGADMGVLK